jgi:hypothetical protein
MILLCFFFFCFVGFCFKFLKLLFYLLLHGLYFLKGYWKLLGKNKKLEEENSKIKKGDLKTKEDNSKTEEEETQISGSGIGWFILYLLFKNFIDYNF